MGIGVEGIGRGLSGFANTFFQARENKRRDEERKKRDLINLMVEGAKSPNFRGDYGLVLQHMGEIMGAKGKDLDNIAPMLGKMFGMGREPGKLMGVSQESGPGGKPIVAGWGAEPARENLSPFRSPGEQQQFEMEAERKKEYAQSQGRLPARLREIEAAGAEREEVARIQAQARAEAERLRQANMLARIDKTAAYRINLQRDQLASKLGVPSSDPRVQDFYNRQLEAELAKAEAQPGLITAQTAAAQANAAAIPQRVEQGAARVAQGAERVGIAQQNADTARARLERAAGGVQNIRAFEMKAFQQAADDLDLIKNARTGITAEKQQKALEFAMRKRDELQSYGFDVEMGTDANGWAYIKRGPASSAFGEVPGVSVAARTKAPAKVFPASKLGAYAKKHTNGNINAARKEITSGGYTIDENK